MTPTTPPLSLSRLLPSGCPSPHRATAHPRRDRRSRAAEARARSATHDLERGRGGRQGVEELGYPYVRFARCACRYDFSREIWNCYYVRIVWMIFSNGCKLPEMLTGASKKLQKSFLKSELQNWKNQYLFAEEGETSDAKTTKSKKIILLYSSFSQIT